MEDSSFISHLKRIDEAKKQVPLSNEIVGAIVILPDTRDKAGDPKDALRAVLLKQTVLLSSLPPMDQKKMIRLNTE